MFDKQVYQLASIKDLPTELFRHVQYKTEFIAMRFFVTPQDQTCLEIYSDDQLRRALTCFWSSGKSR